MRVAYLILTHNNPAHLGRLIGRLRTSNAHFYVHVDRKADIAQFLGAQAQDVTFCDDRTACYWGGLGLVDATLKLTGMALAADKPFDYMVLLSGACYPIKTPEYIESYLSAHQGTEFIEAFSFPDPAHGKRLDRVSSYWLTKARPFIGLRLKFQKVVNRFITRDYQKAFAGLDLAVGSQWWTLSRDALIYISNFLRQNPGFYAFCKRIDCPDEFVFQTILWNSPFKNAIGHSLTYTSWLPGASGPETITLDHLPAFNLPIVVDADNNNCPHPKQEVLFARKLLDSSSDVLQALDAVADKNSSTVGSAHQSVR